MLKRLTLMGWKHHVYLPSPKNSSPTRICKLAVAKEQKEL